MNNSKTVLDYLNKVQIQNLLPNFWMSEEYIQKAGCIWHEERGLKGFIIDSGQWFLPPIDKEDKFVTVGENIYAGFALKLSPNNNAKFLDYQFIYNAKSFSNLSGGKWAVFRKNIRKYITRNPGTLQYKYVQSMTHTQQLETLLIEWSDKKIVYDPDIMVRYVMEGGNRWGLFRNNILIGLNIYDENFEYINFRFCIDNRSPFLNELLRYYFYITNVNGLPNKLVNDGGTLDSDNLYKFKLKLNPDNILRVFSYERESK